MGPMRSALEAAEVRMAPGMDSHEQQVQRSVSAILVLGWREGLDGMRRWLPSSPRRHRSQHRRRCRNNSRQHRLSEAFRSRWHSRVLSSTGSLSHGSQARAFRC